VTRRYSNASKIV